MNRISVITTASLPWLTGASIHPLCLSACLSEKGNDVTLFLPWVRSHKAQKALFPPGMVFSTPEEQKKTVKKWIKDYFPKSAFNITFYPAVHISLFGSIYPLVNIASILPESDITIMEEPEHLFFFQPAGLKKIRARKVCGIILSNYSSYVNQAFGRLSFLITPIFDAYDLYLKRKSPVIVRISSVLKGPGHCVSAYINGVLPKFFSVAPNFSETVPTPFFVMGKIEWFKGFKTLADYWSLLPADIRKKPVHCFGSGIEKNAIIAYSENKGLKLSCFPPVVSLEQKLAPYKTFINASTTEGMSTTSMNALAMGKWLIIPEHPSNEFFYSFSNCLTYSNAESFGAAVCKSFFEKPAPLPEKEATDLSWNKATERLLDIL